MSLLDKATIITTPTAHSNGVLHSIKGGSVADFDVVRGSAATRVNAEGLIEDIRVIGDEEITNGDFSSGSTNWALDGEVTIGGNLAHFESNTNTYSYIRQDISSLTSKTYKIQLEVKNYVSGAVQVAFSGASPITQNLNVSTDGVYTAYLTPNANGDVFEVSREFNGGNFNFDITNISIVEVIDATNIPRIDYTDGTASILLEPQSTNLLPYSEDFSQWTAINSSIVSNVITSPSGEINATKIVENSALGAHRLDLGTVASATQYTVSVFAKAGERSVLSFGGLGLYGNNEFVQYDLVNGTAINTGTTNNATASIENYGNGWYKCAATYTATGTSGLVIVMLDQLYTGNPNSATGQTYQGDGTSGLYIYGAQVEALPYATSYIPTNGAIATRLADSVTGAGDETTFNSTEGVLYAEIAALADDGASRILSLSDGTTANRVNLFFDTSNVLRAFITGVPSIATGAVITDSNKVALKYKSGDISVWLNGVEVATSTNTIALSGLSDLSFSQVGSTPLLAKVKSVITFDTALTDAELECLTTI